MNECQRVIPVTEAYERRWYGAEELKIVDIIFKYDSDRTETEMM